MNVNQGDFYVFMPQKLLYVPDTYSRIHQMRSKTMTEGVGRYFKASKTILALNFDVNLRLFIMTNLMFFLS